MSDIENINDNEELYLFLKNELEEAKQLAEKHKKINRIYSIIIGASLIITTIIIAVFIYVRVIN